MEERDLECLRSAELLFRLFAKDQACESSAYGADDGGLPRADHRAGDTPGDTAGEGGASGFDVVDGDPSQLDDFDAFGVESYADFAGGVPWHTDFGAGGEE